MPHFLDDCFNIGVLILKMYTSEVNLPNSQSLTSRLFSEGTEEGFLSLEGNLSGLSLGLLEGVVCLEL